MRTFKEFLKESENNDSIYLDRKYWHAVNLNPSHARERALEILNDGEKAGQWSFGNKYPTKKWFVEFHDDPEHRENYNRFGGSKPKEANHSDEPDAASLRADIHIHKKPSGTLNIEQQRKQHEISRQANDFRVRQIQKNSKRFANKNDIGFTPYGWKLHLNVPEQNRKEVSIHLARLGIEHKVGGDDKYGEGKNITVYTGSKNKTDWAANHIHKNLGHLIDDTHERVLKDGNIPINSKVSTRFNIGYYDHRFAEKPGHRGISFLADDHTRLFKDTGPQNKKQKLPDHLHNPEAEKAHRRAHELLTKTYGEYYTGPKDEKYSW